MKSVLRFVVLAAVVVCATVSARAGEAQTITARQAHEMALNGELVLVDIRSRQEWIETGVGASAHPISMHESDFLARLDALIGNDRATPIAVICAGGVRSSYMQTQLTVLGFETVYDVAEGMVGGEFGPGWLVEGLPVTPFEP